MNCQPSGSAAHQYLSDFAPVEPQTGEALPVIDLQYDSQQGDAMYNMIETQSV